MIPCPAGGLCWLCGGATRATAKKESKNMSETTRDAIRLVMLFGMTPKQEAEINQAAARAGVAPLIYLYNLVRTEPERFVVPVVNPPPALGG